VPFVEIPMGLAVGDIDRLRVIVVVRPGTLVALSPPLKGGKIVVVGATVGMLGLNGDDDLTEIGAPVGGNTLSRVAIEKDMEKLADFDPSNAAERKRKRLQFPTTSKCVRTNKGGRN